MQQADIAKSYYQSYQPHPQPPTPAPNPNPTNPATAHTSWPAATAFASAPPVTDPGHVPSAVDQPSNYSSSCPPFPPRPDHVIVTDPTAPSAYSYSYDQNQAPYYPYDLSQTAPSCAPANPSPNPNSSYPGAQFLSTYEHLGASGAPPNFGSSYETSVKFDHLGGYADEGRSRYRESYDSYDSSFDYRDARFGDEGVYRYEGGKVEPYGARGIAGGPRSSSSSSVIFDDYGRPISLSNGEDHSGSRVSSKVVRAIPKAENEEDVKGGVQKFRVKLLSEGYGQSDMDVLCQIGLDGICMLDPSTIRTLRIYSLDEVTRWEVLDSCIFAFWARTSVNIEPKRIRLKSNSYTTNAILDTVTAAIVQLKEMGDRKDSETFRTSEQQMERKKGFVDWMNLMKSPNEEKDHWVPDEAVTKCTSCGANFNAFVRRHHCRNCGEIFCDRCTQGRTPLTADEDAQPVRVCDRCMAEVTQRLAYAKESARSGASRSHEDLAKRLKEEMNKNAKGPTGSRSEGSRVQMREVACPTCTVHLQVQVPTSGSETIECSVCQHPFLVSSH